LVFLFGYGAWLSVFVLGGSIWRLRCPVIISFCLPRWTAVRLEAEKPRLAYDYVVYERYAKFKVLMHFFEEVRQ
jgi:hypothetical protein